MKIRTALFTLGLVTIATAARNNSHESIRFDGLTLSVERKLFLDKKEKFAKYSNTVDVYATDSKDFGLFKAFSWVTNFEEKQEFNKIWDIVEAYSESRYKVVFTIIYPNEDVYVIHRVIAITYKVGVFLAIILFFIFLFFMGKHLRLNEMASSMTTLSSRTSKTTFSDFSAVERSMCEELTDIMRQLSLEKSKERPVEQNIKALRGRPRDSMKLKQKYFLNNTMKKVKELYRDIFDPSECGDNEPGQTTQVFYDAIAVGSELVVSRDEFMEMAEILFGHSRECLDAVERRMGSKKFTDKLINMIIIARDYMVALRGCTETSSDETVPNVSDSPKESIDSDLNEYIEARNQPGTSYDYVETPERVCYAQFLRDMQGPYDSEESDSSRHYCGESYEMTYRQHYANPRYSDPNEYTEARNQPGTSHDYVEIPERVIDTQFARDMQGLYDTEESDSDRHYGGESYEMTYRQHYANPRSSDPNENTEAGNRPGTSYDDLETPERVIYAQFLRDMQGPYDKEESEPKRYREMLL